MNQIYCITTLEHQILEQCIVGQNRPDDQSLDLING